MHLAGKSGDEIAQLISTLMELKRSCTHNPSLMEGLNKNIQALQTLRDEKVARKKDS